MNDAQSNPGAIMEDHAAIDITHLLVATKPTHDTTLLVGHFTAAELRAIVAHMEKST